MRHFRELASERSRHFVTSRWLLRHAVMVALVGAFLALGWWQIGRAAAGSTLSLAYAVEWPLFAVFVIAIWVRELRIELRGPTAPQRPVAAPVSSGLRSAGAERPAATREDGTIWAPGPARAEASAEDTDDFSLAAYNEYLAWLAADPARRPQDYPREAR